MRELTLEEVKEIIGKLNGNTYEDHGSSRAVYCVEFKDEFYAVKIALDEAGSKQNCNELEMFMDYESLEIFAPIEYYYKDIILVMKYVTCLNTEEVEDMVINDAYIDDDELNYDGLRNYTFRERHTIVERIRYVYREACEILGDSTDNYQIGLSDLQPYLYDYGYNGDASCIGKMYRYICHNSTLDSRAVNRMFSSRLGRDIVIDNRGNRA